MAMGQPNFKVALLSVNFDSSYTNVLHFTSRSQQQSYFNLPARFSNAPLANFNATSLLETSVNFNANPTDNLNTLCMQNYCIIQDLSGSEISYFFYFVRRARQLSGYNIQLDLELDIFQTYYIEAQFTDCLIDRTHLDRFVEVGNTRPGYVRFDTTNKFLLLREPTGSLPKRITHRAPLVFRYDAEPTAAAPTTFDTQLNKDFYGWVYIYCDLQSISKEISSGSDIRRLKTLNTTYTDATGKNGVLLPYMILCAPISSGAVSLQYSRVIDDETTKTAVISPNAVQWFVDNYAPYIYNIKYSAIAPFRFGSGTWSSVTNGIRLTQTVSDDNNYACVFGLLTSGTNAGGLIALESVTQIKNPAYAVFPGAPSDPYSMNNDELGIEHVFQKSSIIGAIKSVSYNPKLYNPDYMEFYLTDGLNNKHQYDLQKLWYLGDSEGKYIYVFEPYSADTTNIYAWTIGGDYLSDGQEAYVGLSSVSNLTFPYNTDQLTAYLAQNKNYYLQLESTVNLQKLNMRASIASGVVGALTGIGAGSVSTDMATTIRERGAAAERAGIGIAGGIANTIIGGITKNAAIENYQAQAEWTRDNMRSAPDSLSGGNPFMPLCLDNLRYTVEIWDIFDSDKQIANDYMCQFGYSYGAVGNIKDFDHSRKYYNYIRAEVQEVSSTAYALSMAVHDRFQQAFAEGVRFWHWDGTSDGITYDYDLENYEISLES